LARASVPITVAISWIERRVERCAQPDRFREHRRRSGGHAVQRFGPPVVLRHLQPRDGRGLVHHLRDLFFQRHPRDQVVDPLFERQRGIEIRRTRIVGAVNRRMEKAPDSDKKYRFCCAGSIAKP
jgi:hypothetical protein